LPYLKPHWGTIVQALCCTLVFTAVWPLLAWQAGKMLALLVQGDVPALTDCGTGGGHFFGTKAGAIWPRFIDIRQYTLHCHGD